MAALMYPASMLPLLLFQNSAAMLGPGMRHTLRMNKQSLPILYNPEAADVSVEHVVPLSVLRKESASLLDDPYNMHLSASRYNSIRSNYRFWFTSEPDRESHMEAVGHGNYVSHRYKMFTPPERDWPAIFRAVMYCHNAYGVAYDKVLVGGKPRGGELAALHRSPFRGKDVQHAILAAQIQAQSQSINQERARLLGTNKVF